MYKHKSLYLYGEEDCIVQSIPKLIQGSHSSNKSDKNMNTNSLNVNDNVLVRNCNGGVEVCKIVEMEGEGDNLVLEFEQGILQTNMEWLDEMFIRKVDRKEAWMIW